MAFRPIKVDREKLTIMGVKFPNEEALEKADNAIGSAMYEGFRPKRKDVEKFRDIAAGKLTTAEMVKAIRNAHNVG